MGRWFAAATALLVAILLHTFYVDYKVNATGYLVSWPATPSQRSGVLDNEARRRVRPRKERRHFVAGTRLYEQMHEHVARYCDTTERYRRMYILDKAYADPDDDRYFRCSKKFVAKPEKEFKIITPGLRFAEARASVEKSYASRAIRFGMVPASVVAGDEPSRTSFVKSYWFGVIVPLALLLLWLFIVVMQVRRRGNGARVAPADASSIPPTVANATHEQVPTAREILGSADTRETGGDAQYTLADVLKNDLGDDFPVSVGNGKRDSPLVITATSDYVSVEYAVVRHMLSAIGEEYKLSEQALLNLDGRQVDMLVFDVKNAGAADWEGLRRFYFDITAGFGALR